MSNQQFPEQVALAAVVVPVPVPAALAGDAGKVASYVDGGAGAGPARRVVGMARGVA